MALSCIIAEIEVLVENHDFLIPLAFDAPCFKYLYILSVFGYCIVVSLTAFSVICNKAFYKVYTLLSHTPHHTKSPLGSRGRDIPIKYS